ncbi:MAG TPA: NAD(P)H-hydrate dehydratase [Acidimicrobiales bacterium]|nr:NAD(P)H-hydrate dehydratase [Acidimicrobiales bacterium]
MQPVVSVEQMQELDARAIATVGLDRLIERAGYAAAMVARRMLGGLYGRRIVVIAGKGHNGDDGRSCARVLRSRGAQVTVFGVAEAHSMTIDADLVIDGAYGTGFHGDYVAPRIVGTTKVLALDIASGVDAMTGVAAQGAVRADVTVTFGAYKPGLFFHDGPTHSGEIVLDPIGLEVDLATCWLIDQGDVIEAIPLRQAGAHKWDHAILVLAGSPGMTGAAHLCALGALRAGASMVRLGAPGVLATDYDLTEAVSLSFPLKGAVAAISHELTRCRALVVGPGLSLDRAILAVARKVIFSVTELPIVVDADGLSALGSIGGDRPPLFAHNPNVIVTPHDGEFARLFGRPPGVDRIGDANELAQRLGGVVLLKGPTTIVAGGDGAVFLINSGSSALATAGTGDVLSGVIGALLARGVEPVHATAIAAYLHGRAGRLYQGEGLIASDLPALIARLFGSIEDPVRARGEETSPR